jgi:hypothetical protein
MKWVLGGVLLMALAVAAVAETGAGGMLKLRLANAASEACQANCSNAAAQCKRVCPAVLGTSCIATCDAQHQSCQQGCQVK